MKAGIIAAGLGERLAKGGITVPKPLVTLGGETMIARAIQAAARLKVSSVACIVNDLTPEVARFLRTQSWPVSLEIVIKTTSSSMESLFELSNQLGREPFVLFTVDAVFGPGTLEKFVTEALSFRDALGVLALTGFVDDEKPLWVSTDARQRVIALGDAAGPGSPVTAGFYYFLPEIFDFVEIARALKLNALRQFLGLLAKQDRPLYGVPVGKTLDVDFPEDIEKAEIFLRTRNG